MIENRAFVFDLIGTLVPFRTEPFGLRFGIRELFQLYQQAGNSVFVTTSETTGYARETVEDAKLTEVVTNSLGVSAGKGNGKVYKAIADLLGYSNADAAKMMLICGDSHSDRPNDLDGVVLIQQYDAYNYDAQVHKIVASRLYDAGKGDFSEGFAVLEKQGGGGVVDFGDSIVAELQRMQPEYPIGEVSNPVLEIYAGSKWRKDLERITPT